MTREEYVAGLQAERAYAATLTDAQGRADRLVDIDRELNRFVEQPAKRGRPETA